MDGNQNPNVNNNQNPNPTPAPNNAPNGGINWTDELVEKLSKVWDGSANAKGKTAVSAFLKQKGVSEEELDTAVAEFIQKRKASEPDVNAILATNKAQAEELAQYRLRDATSELADELGFDVKNIKRMLKAAASDLEGVMKEDGSVDSEKLKTALTSLLTDLPEFKKSTNNNDRSFKEDKPDAGAKKPEGNKAPAKSNRPKNSRDLIADIMAS